MEWEPLVTDEKPDPVVENRASDQPGLTLDGGCIRQHLPTRTSEKPIHQHARQRSYAVVIFSSLSRLAVIDSSTELFPLIHAPPSLNRDWRISSVTVP
jgi:hypothetical protein